MNKPRTVGVVAIATAVVLLASGTGSFTALQADRPANLAIADDESALIGYDASCGTETLKDRLPGHGNDDDLLDASVLTNRSADSDDDVVDAAIGSEKTAETDDDVVDLEILANKSSGSDDDVVNVDVFSDGVHLDFDHLRDLLADVTLTVTITNQFDGPLEGSVTVAGTTEPIGPIQPGARENVTFDEGFEPGDPITVESTRPTRATLHRSVPEDCQLPEKGTPDWKEWKQKIIELLLEKLGLTDHDGWPDHGNWTDGDGEKGHDGWLGGDEEKDHDGWFGDDEEKGHDGWFGDDDETDHHGGLGEDEEREHGDWSPGDSTDDGDSDAVEEGTEKNDDDRSGGQGTPEKRRDSADGSDWLGVLSGDDWSHVGSDGESADASSDRGIDLGGR